MSASPHRRRVLQAAGLSLETYGRHRGRTAQRERIKAALLEDASRSDRATAKLLECSDKTVATVRAELEATAEIPQLVNRTGEDGRTRRTAPRPQVSKEEFEARAAQIVREHDEERLPWNEIGERHGLKPQSARDAYRIATGARDREPSRLDQHVDGSAVSEDQRNSRRD